MTAFAEEEYLKALHNPHKPAPDPGECLDLHDQCQTWAKSGECEKNPDYVSGL